MNKDIMIVLLIIFSMIIIVHLVFWYIDEIDKENAKTAAKEILDFRTTEYSCDQLKTFFLERYYKKYNSSTDLRWFWEVRDKFIDTGCIGETQLNNLEFIEICTDSRITGCEISKLKYPEAYENFNFRESIKNTNSTQWQKLGERK